ncbi:MAG: hypothetical protein HY390_05395 [Deltaproteobacteria bacterium]|nr:hypothetical protein [Deltaproteobacteria bacterium]
MMTTESDMNRFTRGDIFILGLGICLLIPTLVFLFQTYSFYTRFELGSEERFGIWTAQEYFLKFDHLSQDMEKFFESPQVVLGYHPVDVATLDHLYQWIPDVSPQKNNSAIVRMLLQGRQKNGFFYYQRQRIEPHQSVSFHFATLDHPLSAVILRPIHPRDLFDPSNRFPIQSQILFSSVPEKILPQIKMGDTMINRNGKVIAKILKILTIEKTSVLALLEVWGEPRQTHFFFHDTPLTEGGLLVFETFQYSLEGMCKTITPMQP